MRIEILQKILDKLRGKGKVKKIKPTILYKNAKEILKKNKIIKLHLGCGTQYKDSWINIDNNSDFNIKKLDLKWDLRKPLPFPDNSVDFIYHEHMLEHLTVEEGQKFLKDCLRVLKSDGVMRIAMPDLYECVQMYNNSSNWKEKDKESLRKFGLEHVQNRAEMINIDFRCWGHKWLYDWEELERRLREAGCEKIKKCKLAQSDYCELSNLESREQSNLIAEIIK